jgi:UDP-GlcNAc:undecaprenyl-phosphate GlcNAc-1-phosphate transferase
MRIVALKTNFVDSPNSLHKSHVEPVPYLGGVAIMFGVLVTIYLALMFENNASKIPLASSILVPALILGLVGLVDDKFSLPPLPRFIAQSIAGALTAWLITTSNNVGNPTGNEALDVLVSIFWFVFITNSINFFDNVDGGASGAMAVISIALFGITFINGQVLIAAVSIILFGAMLGFLFWNKSPARIYMGDAGSLFLGVLISVLTIRLDPQTDSKSMSLAVPILIMAIPILDTTVAVFSRLRRRQSPFKGGRDHLSHRLMRAGLPKQKAVAALWSLTAFFAFLGLAVSVNFYYSKILLIIATVSWLLLATVFLKLPDTDQETKVVVD